jgi:uncharacterized membrane protein
MNNEKPGISNAPIDHLRFHRPHAHLNTTFGNNAFALRAEAFARFFGTPLFLGAQTLIVAVWIGLNVWGVTQFDVYPFILLNLAFSLQAAYAAPLILLAQTRQAARDKAQPTPMRSTAKRWHWPIPNVRLRRRRIPRNCWRCWNKTPALPK